MNEPSAQNGMVNASVKAIYPHPTQHSPVIFIEEIALTKDEKEKFVLSMVIGLLEAQAIISAWQGIAMPRPVTSDLMYAIITEDFRARITRIEITDIKDGAYLSNLVLDDGGREIFRDCRPSDSIALAVRAKCPIVLLPALVSKTMSERENTRALLKYLEAEAQDSDDIVKF